LRRARAGYFVNQIVHVVTAKPVKGFAAMDTVWVDGTLKLSRQDSQMGVSGYRMEAALVSCPADRWQIDSTRS
jgi:hypothetical protein